MEILGVLIALFIGFMIGRWSVNKSTVSLGQKHGSRTTKDNSKKENTYKR